LVAEVRDLWWATDPPNLAAILETDPPRILDEALRVFAEGVMATRAENLKVESERQKAKQQERRNRG
jgi:hypothetical protein